MYSKSTTKPKILQLLHEDLLSPTGGMGIHVAAICRELAPRCDITVLGLDNRYLKGGLYRVYPDHAEQVELADWKHDGRCFRLLNLWNQNEHLMVDGIFSDIICVENYILNYLQFLKDESFDLVHMHDTYLEPVARTIQVCCQIPMVVTAQLSYLGVHGFGEDDKSVFWIEREMGAYHRADHVIVVSEAYRRLLDEMFVVNDTNQNVTVIHNGVDYEKLCAIEPEPIAECGKPVVSFIGRMVPSKGIELIVEAARVLPEFHFILCSQVSPTMEPLLPLTTMVREAVEGLSNFEWWRMISFDAKWPPLIARTDIAVMPSLHEPFGIVALEWLSVGKPLVVSDVGGLSEFCNDGNSVPIEPTTDALIQGILKVHRMTISQRDSMVAAGRRTAQAMSWAVAAKATQRVYEEALSANA